MLTIVISPQSPLTKLLYHTLARSYEVLCVARGEVLLPDIAPEIVLVEAPRPLECDGDVIYILGAQEEGEAAAPFSPGPRAVAVIQSADALAMRFAAQHHIKTLTCGMSSRDTLTLSSIEPERAVVCLQREIATFGGGVLEPVEIPVRLGRPVESAQLLTLAAVVLLCGSAEPMLELLGSPG